MDQLPDHLSNPPPSTLLPEILPAQPAMLIGHSTIAYQLPEGNSPEAIRARIPLLKEITERCYMRLARDLWEVYQLKHYVKFGFSTFDDYVATEVGISKDRSYKLRRIFSVLVLKCDIPTSQVEVAERSRVEMILSVVNRDNAKDWLTDAKTLPYKELRNKLIRETTRRRGVAPSATPPDKPDPTTPIRLACESPRAQEPGNSQEFVQRTFRLPDDGDTLLTEALAIAQRVTGSHSDNFNLICMAQQFLAQNLTTEGKDDGRRGYFQRWMEEIYGGWFLHVRSDEAWDVLREAVEGRPDLFGTSEREDTHVDRYNDEPNDRNNPDDHRGPDDAGVGSGVGAHEEDKEAEEEDDEEGTCHADA